MGKIMSTPDAETLRGNDEFTAQEIADLEALSHQIADTYWKVCAEAGNVDAKFCTYHY